MCNHAQSRSKKPTRLKERKIRITHTVLCPLNTDHGTGVHTNTGHTEKHTQSVQMNRKKLRKQCYAN